VVAGARLLPLACHQGEHEIVRMLLDHGAPVNDPGELAWAPLHIAARDGFVDCVLEVGGARRDATQRLKRQPLRVTCGLIDPMVCTQLLKHGADVDLVDSDRGWTPLICAAAHNQLAVVNVLLDAGARADVADLDQWTAHDHAIFEGYMECGTAKARIFNA